MVNTLKSASRFGVLTTLAEDGKSPKSRASSRIDIERKSSCGHRNGTTDRLSRTATRNMVCVTLIQDRPESENVRGTLNQEGLSVWLITRQIVYGIRNGFALELNGPVNGQALNPCFV